MADHFLGTWDCVSIENFGAFLDVLGVPPEISKVLGAVRPKLTFEVEGDNWTMIRELPTKTVTLHFKLGVEFEEEVFGETHHVKTTLHLEDGKLIQNLKGEKGTAVVTREVHGSNMTARCKVKDVVATIHFKKE